MERVEISLARALKLKNRLAGRLAKLDTDLASYNSLPTGTDGPDLKITYAERGRLVSQLLELKVAINAANQPAQRTIFELAEAKSLVALLAKMSTRHGKVIEQYSGAAVDYVAQFRKGDIDREVRRLEVTIDRLQEQLDSFNHKTAIGIEGALLREIEATPPPPGA